MSLISKENESHDQIELQIKKPTLRYLDEFIKLKCAPDLLAQGLFPNAKEITESMAAFNAIRKNCIYPGEIQYDNTDTCVIDIGCGSTPRTAALCAMRTNWDCFGIDPRLNSRDYHIKRLIGIPLKLNDFMDCLSLLDKRMDYLSCLNKLRANPINYDNHIYIATHAHLPFQEIADYMCKVHREKSYLIYMPCCKYVPGPSYFSFYYEIPYLNLKSKEYEVSLIANYEDYGIHSPYRRIYVYRIGD